MPKSLRKIKKKITAPLAPGHVFILGLSPGRGVLGTKKPVSHPPQEVTHLSAMVWPNLPPIGFGGGVAVQPWVGEGEESENQLG